MQLRDYQQDVIDRSHSTTEDHIVVLPTGSGKGNLIAYDLYTAYQQGKTVILAVPLIELVRDLESRLATNYPETESAIYSFGGRCKSASPKIFIGVYKTIHNLIHYLPKADLIISDEAHRSVAKSWDDCLNLLVKSTGQNKGYTATPHRLDGKVLGNRYQSLIVGPETRDLINSGYLSRFDYYSAYKFDLSSVSEYQESLDEFLEFDDSRDTLRGSFIDQWRDPDCYGKQTIFFCKSLEASHRLCGLFNKTFPFEFRVISGKTPDNVRLKYLEEYKAGKIKGIFNKSVFCEGVDAPSTEVLFLGDRTESLVRHKQACGRALRLKPHGRPAKIYDFVGNYTRSGLPDFVFEWDIHTEAVIKKDSFHKCFSCGCLLAPKSSPLSFMLCPVCQTHNSFILSLKPIERNVILDPEHLNEKLEKLTVKDEDFRLWRIINSKKKHQDKVQSILDLKSDNSTKLKGLLLLGMLPDTANLVIGETLSEFISSQR